MIIKTSSSVIVHFPAISYRHHPIYWSHSPRVCRILPNRATLPTCTGQVKQELRLGLFYRAMAGAAVSWLDDASRSRLRAMWPACLWPVTMFLGSGMGMHRCGATIVFIVVAVVVNGVGCARNLNKGYGTNTSHDLQQHMRTGPPVLEKESKFLNKGKSKCTVKVLNDRSWGFVKALRVCNMWEVVHSALSSCTCITLVLFTLRRTPVDR